LGDHSLSRIVVPLVYFRSLLVSPMKKLMLKR
jgi:hypothetical protein